MNIPHNYIQQLKKLPRHGTVQLSADEKAKFEAKRLATRKELAKTSKEQATYENEISEINKDVIPGLKETIALEKSLDNLRKTSGITLNDLIASQTKFATGVINLSKKILILEQRNKELNKAFGINKVQAAILGKTYDDLAVSFGVSGETTRKYGQDLNKLLPGLQKTVAGSGKLGSSLFKLQNAFQQNLGLSGETANNFIRFAGGSEEALTSTLETAQALEEVTGLQGLNRDLTRDLSNLAPQIQLQFSRIPGSLELAVLKAKTLGVSFGEIAAIGGKLLDVESSVNDELEYQLLSGKRLVDQNGKSLTQQFRTAAIQGDANAQTDALNKILETQGDTIEKNVFARQQLAKTLGIEESKLSGMVQQRKLLNQLGPEAEKILELQGEDLATAVDKFKAEQPKLAGNLDKLLEVSDTRTTDEKLVEALGSLNALLASTALGGKKATDESIKETINALAAGFIKTTDNVPAATEKIEKLVKSGNSLISTFSPLLSTFQNTINEFSQDIKDLTSIVPVFGNVAEKITTAFEKIITGVTGDNVFPEKFSGGATSVSATVNPVEENDSIIRLNDAILFNPNDKFNIVASTSPGALDQATADISGKGQSNGPSAQEIGSAVAQALAGVNLYVSPNELAAEMAFNSYNINT
jgi:hypothetical protein